MHELLLCRLAISTHTTPKSSLRLQVPVVSIVSRTVDILCYKKQHRHRTLLKMRPAWLVLAAAVTAGLFDEHAESCSPPIGPQPVLTKAQKAHFADSILVGKILQTYDDPDLHYGDSSSSAYSATMEVYCIYKGAITASLVNITHVGSIPGLCISTKLEVGLEYVVYLSSLKNRINEVQMENTEQLRHNVSRACGLTLRYPDGKSANDVPHECPEPAMDTDCVPKYIHKETTMPSPPPPLTDHDHEDHDHEDHVHEDHDHESHDHEGHDHEDHDDEDHDHEGQDHEDHDHKGHDHEGHDHEGHDHEDHDHEGHDHEDHDHKGHEHEGHDHEGHDYEDHDHEGHDHEGHDHEGHDHEHHDPRHEHKDSVKADASRTSNQAASQHVSYMMASLILILAASLSP